MLKMIILVIFLKKKKWKKEIKEKKGTQKEEGETIMKDIICNLLYVLISLYRRIRLFIFVAINFWYSDYLQNWLMENKFFVYIYNGS